MISHLCWTPTRTTHLRILNQEKFITSTSASLFPTHAGSLVSPTPTGRRVTLPRIARSLLMWMHEYLLRAISIRCNSRMDQSLRSKLLLCSSREDTPVETMLIHWCFRSTVTLVVTYQLSQTRKWWSWMQVTSATHWLHWLTRLVAQSMLQKALDGHMTPSKKSGNSMPPTTNSICYSRYLQFLLACSWHSKVDKEAMRSLGLLSDTLPSS